MNREREREREREKERERQREIELLTIDKGDQFIIYRPAPTVEQVLTQSTFGRHTDCIIYQQKINIKELDLNGFHSNETYFHFQIYTIQISEELLWRRITTQNVF